MIGIMFGNDIMGHFVAENGVPVTKGLDFSLLVSHVYSLYVSAVFPVVHVEVNVVFLGHIESNSLYIRIFIYK